MSKKSKRKLSHRDYLIESIAKDIGVYAPYIDKKDMTLKVISSIGCMGITYRTDISFQQKSCLLFEALKKAADERGIPQFGVKKPRQPFIPKSESWGPYTPTRVDKRRFYDSWEWRMLRMDVLQKYGRRCQCCGATPADTDVSGRPVKIVVDHIEPISKRWDLRLEFSNLGVLCDECNQGKSNRSGPKYRFSPSPST